MDLTVTMLFLIATLYKVNSFILGKGDSVVKLEHTASGFQLEMDENNHDDDPTRLLFTISIYDSDEEPELLKDPGFEYSIEKFISEWRFYANSSFDYETQLHYYVFNLFVGNEYRTITLVIDNIDDEPPSLKCEKLEMLENWLYNATTSPCSCTISDPDGWLNQVTYTIISDDNEDKIFKFELPEEVADTDHSATVKIINNVLLHADEKSKYEFIVEAKDGAGHGTVPDPDISLTITVL